MLKRAVVCLAAPVILAASAAGVTPAAASSCPTANTFGPICLLVASQWPQPATTELHIVGELQNTGATNLADIRITIQLNTANGPKSDTVDSSLEVLAPSETTPFEDSWSPVPAGYLGTFQITSIKPASSASAPAHSFLLVQDGGCTAPIVCGTVTNTSDSSMPAPITADNVRVVMTFDDGAGNLAQDVIWVDDGTGGTTIGPGQTASYYRDRSGEPALPMVAAVGETSYPADLNPGFESFSGQVVGTTSGPEPVTLINNGPRTMNISSIGTTGDFAQSNNCGASLSASASCTINLTFSPTGLSPKTRTGSLIVNDDVPGTAQSIPLSGIATAPHAHFDPSTLDFASQGVGSSSAPQTTNLTNTGDGPMTITSFGIGPDFTQTNNCPGVLAPAAQCQVAVTFAPQQIANNLSESLTVQDDAIDTPESVTLTGTGVGAAVQLQPATLDFGSQLYGTPSGARTITLTDTGNGTLTIGSISTTGDFAQTNDCGTSVAAGDHCTINVTFNPTAVGPRSGTLNLTDNAGSQSASLSGTGLGRPAAVYHATPTLSQYTLNGSDGRTWQLMDGTNLVLSVPVSTAPGTALLTANADLWTERAGVNQDIGIFVNNQLVAWKESGGYAGTFSPNAAAIQVIYPLAPNTTYTIDLRWKANVATSARIHAGAGTGPFSPTTLSAQIASTLVGTQSTSQYILPGSDGATWQDIDASALALTIPASTVTSTAVISGNADLWTERAGVNQDLGIFLDGSLIGWKESGGYAGTFSPNAALVQLTASLTPNRSHLIELRWKTNIPTSGHIRAGAGTGPFSPTTLNVNILGASTTSALSTTQYRLPNSDGNTWQAVDGTNLVLSIPVSGSPATAILSANADLWTERAGVNQDLAIFVNGQLVAWKESGGYAGTFSPNAAYVQIVVQLQPGTNRIELRWKTNHPTGAVIHAGAGTSPYSPTVLTAQLPAS